MRRTEFAATRDSTGYANVAGSHVSVDEERHKLWTCLIRDDAARLVVDTWHQAQGFPTTDEVPMHQLFDATWRYRPLHEVAMYEKIEDALIEEGCADAPDELSSLLRAMRGSTPTQPDVQRLRQPDIWMLRGHRSETLVMVEVKRRARHLPGNDYDAVAQVCNDVDVAQRVLRTGGWHVSCLERRLVEMQFLPGIAVLSASHRARRAFVGRWNRQSAPSRRFQRSRRSPQAEPPAGLCSPDFGGWFRAVPA